MSQVCRSWSDRLASSVVAAFRANIYRCKRIGDVGAEQLLLDVSSLKGALLELLQISSNLAPSSVKRYSKLVNKEMGRLELLVKVCFRLASGSVLTSTCADAHL
jgi:hypothetical protein